MNGSKEPFQDIHIANMSVIYGPKPTFDGTRSFSLKQPFAATRNDYLSDSWNADIPVIQIL